MEIGTSPQITRETPLRFAARQRAKITGRLPESPAARLLRSCAVHTQRGLLGVHASSCPVYTPFTHSVNAISQHLGRFRCSPLSMLDPRQYLTVESFEIPKDKGLNYLCRAKLDPPRQCPGDSPRVQRAVGAPRGVPSEHPLGQVML